MRTKIVMFATIPFLVEDLWEGIPPYSISDHWGIVGLVLIVAGVLLRSWAAGIIRKTETLTTEGPYALVRHPLYLGSLLIALGFCVLIGDLENFFLVFLILVPLHIRRTLREERKLSEIYGDLWEAYKQRTGAFFPKVLPAHVLISWSPKQWFRNQEYGAFVTSFVILGLVQLWHSHPTFATHLASMIK